jgi:uncharacterized RDD family membrane protein YckC
MSESTTSHPKPAELPYRLVARLIDFLLLIALGWALGRGIGFGYDWLVTTAVSVLAYFVGADAFLGRTLGKAALRLRVIGSGGGKPTLKEAFLRELFIGVGAIPFVGPVAAIAAWTWITVTIRASATRQGWHDLFAGGTQVIRIQ